MSQILRSAQDDNLARKTTTGRSGQQWGTGSPVPAGGLELGEGSEPAPGSQQLIWSALLHQPTGLQNQHSIGLASGGQTMGDAQDRPAVLTRAGSERRPKGGVTGAVDSRRGLIQQ